MQVAFNTIAFPDSTLEQIATFAEHSGYDAIEFRTLGYGVTQVASDPALTDTDKVRRLIREYGTRASGLATSVRFDQPFDLPVIGHAFGDNEKGVRMAKRMIDLAAQLEAPHVRVFAF
ncbi:MAG: TIM barrel protein, partial [Phycisphaerales bacterium]|nr:TIM barrel protein [Phycisphaerales bacterium]